MAYEAMFATNVGYRLALEGGRVSYSFYGGVSTC
jgi:hypothetical protein